MKFPAFLKQTSDYAMPMKNISSSFSHSGVLIYLSTVSIDAIQVT